MTWEHAFDVARLSLLCLLVAIIVLFIACGLVAALRASGREERDEELERTEIDWML